MPTIFEALMVFLGHPNYHSELDLGQVLEEFYQNLS